MAIGGGGSCAANGTTTPLMTPAVITAKVNPSTRFKPKVLLTPVRTSPTEATPIGPDLSLSRSRNERQPILGCNSANPSPPRTVRCLEDLQSNQPLQGAQDRLLSRLERMDPREQATPPIRIPGTLEIDLGMGPDPVVAMSAGRC